MDARTTVAALWLGILASMPLHAQVRVANEGEIRDEWTLAPGTRLPAPGYPAEFADSAETVCLAMGYRIEPDGTTSNFTLLKGWNSAEGEHEPSPGFWSVFAKAAAVALAQWRFQPKPEIRVPRRVETVATMTFMGRQPEEPAALRARCAIRNLADHLAQLKAEQNRRGDMNLHDLERVRQQQQEQQMREALRRANSGVK